MRTRFTHSLILAGILGLLLPASAMAQSCSTPQFPTCTRTTTTSKGKFISGSLTGLEAGDAICDAAFPGKGMRFARDPKFVLMFGVEGAQIEYSPSMFDFDASPTYKMVGPNQNEVGISRSSIGWMHNRSVPVLSDWPSRNCGVWTTDAGGLGGPTGTAIVKSSGTIDPGAGRYAAGGFTCNYQLPLWCCNF